MLVLIIFFASLSYILGARSILSNTYHPSIYSRAIWFFLTLNSFASVIALKDSAGVVVLAGISLLGNLIMLLLSFRKSKRIFGRTELICTILLVLSLLLWIFGNLPFLNLTIGLIAHFIGAAPTYKKVLKDPDDEDIFFWGSYFIASILVVISADKSQIRDYLYPLYFIFFDGSMTLLCARRYFRKAS